MVKFIFEALIVSLMIIVIQTKDDPLETCLQNTVFKPCKRPDNAPDGICDCDLEQPDTGECQVTCIDITNVCRLRSIDYDWEGELMYLNGDILRCSENTICQEDPELTTECILPYDNDDNFIREGYCCKEKVEPIA